MFKNQEKLLGNYYNYLSWLAELQIYMQTFEDTR